ncbi:1-phosphatidylinositol 3-phosphate 5-kinase-like isoform X2 [Gigantopelta aegis]|uniref:1-phosphatidylinositol 3-phosphate 5-kinase-like isoform X2 n=1 Tax=Gigantopelta aegis TaxID=1735272 RepID=UPI001B88A846|nr:1-phosphatidylinositol 3-phosphate 5-kinase-like isoform X2 [Gigantopelta aegis]
MGSRQPWDNTPHTLTEFAPLSSEVRPSGGIFSRFLRRGKDESDNSDSSSAPSSRLSSRETSVERSKLPPGDTHGGVIVESVDPSSVLPTEKYWMKNDDENGSQSSLEGQVPSQWNQETTPKRTLSSVLSRLGNILERRSTTPQAYKDSDFKQYWMPDSSCRECYNCGDKFTTFRRRHHCRICGQIFCSKCCNQELPGKIIGYKGGIRVCQYCCKVVLRYAQQSESSGDMKMIREDLKRLSPIDSEVMLSQEFGLWMPTRAPSVHEDQLPSQRSVSPQDANNGAKSTPFDLTPMADISIQESLILTEDSVQLRMLWRQIQDAETGVEMQSHRIRLRTYLSCIVGKDLVTWLVDHDKVAKRDQAVGIGQALLFANYLEPITNQRIFRDDFSLYKPGEQAISYVESQSDTENEATTAEETSSTEPQWVREIQSIDRDEFDISFERQSTATDSDHQKSQSSETSTQTSFYLGEKTECGSVPNEVLKLTAAPRDGGEEPLPRQDFSTTGLTDDFIKDALFVGQSPHAPDSICFPHAWRNIEQLREENGEKLAYSRLRQAHSELWDALTKQLLSHNGLSMSWECVMSSIIAQISRFVKPDVQGEGDELDIRKYIHVKKIPGGQKTDTSMLHGVMFTKNIAHKKMQQQISNPQIMLLRGAIEYQRVENKFSSLEPQILQEREFLRNSVSKITAFRPSIVIVEKSVSRLAQEFLLSQGVTLVFNVKLRVMERLARFTQADIVPSIDSLVSRPTLGFCHTFKCQSYLLPSGETKTFVVFDGCATNLGCTISLRGGTSGELRKVKDILKFMSYTAYNSLLEISFCMDEFAMPAGTPDETCPIEGIGDGEKNGDDVPDQSCDIDVENGVITNPSDENSSEEDDEKAVCNIQVQFEDDKDDSGSNIDSLLETNQKEASLGGFVHLERSPDNQSSRVLERQKSEHGAQIQHEEITRDDGNNKNSFTENQKQDQKCFRQKDEENANSEDFTKFEKGLTAFEGKDNLKSSPLLRNTNLLRIDSESQIKRTSCEITELTDASDPLLNYQKTKDESIFESSLVEFQEHKQTKQHLFKRLLSGVILSVCPYHQYSLPYLESRQGIGCKLRKFLSEDLYYSPLFEGEGQSPRSKYHDLDYTTKYSTKTNIQITEAHPFILCKLTDSYLENRIQGMLSDFRARGGRIKVLSKNHAKQNGVLGESSPKRPNFMNETNDKDRSKVSTIMFDKKIDCLNPLNHQKISVLFSSYSHKSTNHPNPCVTPWLVKMEFYGKNDITLGGFLERFCFRETYLCPSESCDTPMVDHIRRFSHGTGCINVLVKRLDNEIAGGQNNILLWSWCCVCKQVTPVVPICADTWNLSFAKFLELRFHVKQFTRRAAAEPCNHSLHRDYNLYFGYRDIVTSFRYSEIQLQELALPSIVVDYHPFPIQPGRVKDVVKYITNKGMEKFSAILECTMKLRNEIPSESSARAVSDFVTEQQCEKSKLSHLAQDIQQKITDLLDDDSNTDVLTCMFEAHSDIIRLKRMIVEAVFRWNTKIQEFLSSQQKKMKQATSVKKDKDKDMPASSVDDVDRSSPKTYEKTRTGSDPQIIDVSNLLTVASISSGSSMSDRPLTSSVNVDTEDQTDGRTDKWSRRNIIASFWSGSNFVPVTSPFDPAEHYLLPPSDRVPVVIYDYEPSSVIAYALSSSDYHVRLREIQSCFGSSKKDNSGTSKSGDSPLTGADIGKETEDIESYSLFATSSSSDSDKTKSSNKQTPNSHIELQFSDNVAKFYCRVFFAEQFRKLRKLIFPAGEDLFIRSLSRCKPWEAKGGKSGSTFCKTDDDRFILKQMSNMEIESFEKFGPEYFKYISKAYTEKKPTALAKILGVYRIGFRNTQTNTALKQDLLVMENLFYNRRIAQKYDLKGSLRNRLINTSGKRYEDLVHLDENLLKLSVDSPLYMRPYSKAVLKTAIDSDSDFLSANLIMDYSLLVGLDETKKELVVGIIDYIRTFTWDKKLEMVVKSQISMIGGQGKMPTVVSPQLYRGRFLEAMDRYFLHVPDEWSGLDSDFSQQSERKDSKDDLESSTLKS